MSISSPTAFGKHLAFRNKYIHTQNSGPSIRFTAKRQQGGRWQHDAETEAAIVGRAPSSYAAQLSAQRFQHEVHGVPSLSHSRTNHVLASLTLAKIFLVTFYRTFHKCPIKFASFLVGKQARHKRKGCRTELRMGYHNIYFNLPFI